MNWYRRQLKQAEEVPIDPIEPSQEPVQQIEQPDPPKWTQRKDKRYPPPEPWTIAKDNFNKMTQQWPVYIHYDLRKGSDERIQSIMDEGLRSGMANSARYAPDNTSWQWFRPEQVYPGLDGYFLINPKFTPGARLEPGQIPAAHVKFSQDGQPLHEALIETAISEGKPVPDEVLQDYADFPWTKQALENNQNELV